MQERRFYDRITVDVVCNIYNDNEEIVGKVIDLSEEGMLIEIDLDAYNQISPVKGKKLKYLLVDEIKKFKKNVILMDEISIRHYYIKDNKGYIGCMCTNKHKDFMQYGLDKKSEKFY